MTSPPELLEQALAAHGDSLYRMALLLGGDSRRAEALLRAAVSDLLAAGPLAPLDEPALLAALAAAARRADERASQTRRAAPRPPAGLPPLYRRILLLPLPQRLALGLSLLAGYDLARLARVAGLDEPAAGAALVDAVRAIAPTAGTSLTDRVSGETCPDVRAALADPGGRLRHGAAVRGHLATCGPCRSFDHSWGELSQAAESAMRDTLREQRLPAALAARLAGLARPARRRLSPSLRFGLPPLAVLLVVAALVLPGFSRRAVTVVDAEADPPPDPRSLVAEALERHGSAARRGPAVWHERYETLWYFNDETVAPLHAELWLDRDNPARHRLQLTHTAGGAPYELQLGDGRGTLHYGLDGSYVSSLYGELPVRATAQSPLLLTMNLEAAEQERALAERLRVGPWSIPPFYLSQARQASDLRALGRVSENGRQLQVVSFSGVSPLGRPADAPGATAERVTVMLAIDADDGRLRSATEISGPAGGTQISRMTWRLVEEQALSAAQVSAAFTIGRAWNGLGEFPERVRHEPADLGLLAIGADLTVDPATTLNLLGNQLWLPAAPPPGVDRAVLIWPQLDRESGVPPRGLIYSGPDRQLTVVFDARTLARGEPERVGDWEIWLSAARGRTYRLDVQPAIEGPYDPFTRLSLNARGFSRDELLALVAGMRPIDFDVLAAHGELFASVGDADPQARALLLEVLRAETGDPAAVRFSRAERFSRQNLNLDDPPDPYHWPIYGGFPERRIVETWVAADGAGSRFYTRELHPASGELLFAQHVSSDEGWNHYVTAGHLLRYNGWRAGPFEHLSPGARAALDALVQSPEGLALERASDGSSLIRSSEDAAMSWRYSWLRNSEIGDPYLADLDAERLVTEVSVGPDNRVAGYRLIAQAGEILGGAETTLIDYRVLERAELPSAEVPPELDGAEPQARFSRDWTDLNRNYTVLTTRTLSETLGLADFPVYLLPSEAADSLGVELAEEGMAFLNPDQRDITADLVGAGLAYRFGYRLRPAEDSNSGVLLRITQGPAEPMKAFLAGNLARPWAESFQERIAVAGAERDAWIARGSNTSFAFVDMGETLLIVEGPARWFDENVRSVLARLEPAS